MNLEEIYIQALKEDEGAVNTASAGGSSSIESAAPEHSVTVHNGKEEIDLKESTKERLYARKRLNEALFNSIDNKSVKKDIETIKALRESTFDAAKSWILFEKQEKEGRNSPRYRLQDWTNGGGGDGTEKGQPSAYEAWRREIVDKKRKARLEQEYQDETSPFKSPTTTDVSAKTLDNQEDAFLSWWIEKHGGK
jgi:hypothetical protein